MACTGAVALGGAMGLAAETSHVPARSNPSLRKPLRMQPVLVYKIAQRRQAMSWRTWSGLITEAHADEERNRIRAELQALAAKSDFPLEVLPLVSVRNPEEAKQVAAADHDGVILYHATDTGTPQRRHLHLDGPARLEQTECRIHATSERSSVPRLHF